MNRKESRLFAPYKAVGLVTGDVPAVVRCVPKRQAALVLTAVGNVVHQYDAQSLRLISVSDPLEGVIAALAADQQHVYAAHGRVVSALQISRQEKYRFEKDGHSAAVRFVLPFAAHLVSLDVDGRLLVWEIESQRVYAEMLFDVASFAPTALCHPATYVNKLLVGCEQGALRLVNLKTTALVHHFDGWQSAVTALEQSPAVDVLAVGLRDGRVHLHNIRFDETLFTFRQDWGAVDAIAFRTDGAAAMVTSGAGHLSVWDLDKRKVVGELPALHSANVVGLHSINGEPLLISSGCDNALRTWIFDLPDGLARSLAVRDGHALPATCVRFHGASGEQLLTASQDGTVRLYSTWSDRKQQSLGTATHMSREKARKKQIDFDDVRMPAVVRLDTDVAREADWDNIVCCHEESSVATTWTSRRARMGAHKLRHERFVKDRQLRSAVANACTVSACGNFALVGYSSGHVDLWNVQSGIARGSLEDAQSFDNDLLDRAFAARAHASSVSDICSDALNRQVFTASRGGTMKFWDLKKLRLEARLRLPHAVGRMCVNRDNGMLAAGLDSGDLLVVDTECRAIVRRFLGAHKSAVSDLCFSADGHWLLSCDGGDGLLKVWQVATGALVDVAKFEQPCIGLSLSPTAEFLATCHVGQRGAYLWVNKRLHQPDCVLKALPADFEPTTSALPESAVVRPTPNAAATEGDDAIEVDDDATTEEERPVQLDQRLVSMSGQASVRWAQLVDLDVIRERNKPLEPPAKPKAAPFFLPTVSGLRDFNFVAPAASDAPRSRVVASSGAPLAPQTQFGRSLAAADSNAQLLSAFEVLTQLGPSNIDFELRNLPVRDAASPPETQCLARNFLRLIEAVLGSRKSFDLAQAYLAVFLRVHRRALRESGDSEMRDCLKRLLDATNATWDEIDHLALESNAMLQWLKSAAL